MLAEFLVGVLVLIQLRPAGATKFLRSTEFRRERQNSPLRLILTRFDTAIQVLIGLVSKESRFPGPVLR
ncbi:MAG: hypothetical protein CME32_04815 [Gimesia sp.]|nr:hypothetical protein [Gimesia sp.]